MLVDKLQVIEDKFMDLEQRISDPEVIARQDEWRKLTRQHAQLSETVETFRTYKRLKTSKRGIGRKVASSIIA